MNSLLEVAARICAGIKFVLEVNQLWYPSRKTLRRISRPIKLR